ncbi:SNF2-related protein [uncultured Desulfovibrio sp.]|uniref:helicase-related protein n=1 Tax=uncultured Desulfovibrio sp. TaxID=167968 RepID=UPI0026356F43|nr:SNF2-related protein [uncultured Desulfovibrio sp.]
MRIIDNINTLLGDDLKATLRPKSRLKIAASCFSIYAYEALKSQLSKIESLQFIFTAPAFIAEEATDKVKKERREFFIPKLNRERSLYGSEFEIQLRNKMTQKAIARECATWLRGKAQFRSNKTTAQMQQFACVESAEQKSVYSPLHGFTAVDLGYQPGNAVSNIMTCLDEAPHASAYVQLFDQIWNSPEQLEDVTAAICDHIESIYQENSPERIYFLILYNIFKEFLEDIDADVLPNEKTGYQDKLIWQKLFNFQRDAAIGIINKLETYSGCILADSVGLGKTFTALAVIKYYELRNRSVLVLCPKKLADNWLNYNKNLMTNIFAKDRFSYDVLCHTDLSRTSGESLGIPLDRVNWGNYDLLVIDESHNFRNNEAFKERETRYQKLLNKVIRQGVKTKVLMLSATPVNNRFNDLYNQLNLAYEGDTDELGQKLGTSRSVREIFRQAQAAFSAWSKLPVAERTTTAILEALDFDFFRVLDSVTIARSRKHIQTFYDTSAIGSFPERLKPLSFRSPLTALPDAPDFNAIYAELARLNLAVYAPMSYVLPSRRAKYEEVYDTVVERGQGGTFKQIDRERSLQALMTTNLLKRLESSVQSFRLTTQKLLEGVQNTLGVINTFQAGGKAASVTDLTDKLDVLEPDDEDFDVNGNSTVGGKVKIDLRDMDVDSWKRSLESDHSVLSGLLASLSSITQEHDAKLLHLKGLIKDKLASPINPGNKKILIFTAFADTAEYLFENLSDLLRDKAGIHSGLVTGSTTPRSTLGKGYGFQELLTLFSPRSKEKILSMPDNPHELDLLIGTDCISEGQNLQDCDYLINYDIHWNPVRIIQRFGRIDRIGSRNRVIQLVNYWPDISLDEYINLKERVENRMVIVDAVATGDENVLTAQSSDLAYRKEQLRRLQDEVIDLEDVKTGVSITDLGLNDFRMDLLEYVKSHGEPKNVPNGLHAVIAPRPEVGLVPGVIFALRNRNHAVNIDRQNLLHPYYLAYIDEAGKLVAGHTQVKKLLDMVRAGCKGHAEPLAEACRAFNKRTDEGRNMKACSALLGEAIRSMIRVKEEKDVESLFTGGKTTALVNMIAGLDDFELIAFIVVQGA